MMPVRPFSENEEAISAKILKYCQIKMENTEKYNRYLLGLLNLFHRHQFEHSELIPKVYKLLTLYYSLGRYCNLSEIQLRFLHQPGSIYI